MPNAFAVVREAWKNSSTTSLELANMGLVEKLMTEKINGWSLETAVGPDPHLSQGDLVIFRDSNDPLKEAGIVVTADCDLKNRKHAQLVTLVPIVSILAAMENYLFLEACEGQRRQILDFTCRALKIDSSEESLVIEARLRELFGSIPPDSPQAIAVDIILRRRESLSVKDYSALMNAIGSKAKAASSLETQLLNKGDVLVLPSAQKLGVEGEIAWVRHIWQVPIGQIAMKTSDVKHCPGERVARLDSPYRYRLTQVMAQVFSDIGLPDSTRKFKDDIEKVFANA